MPAVVSGPSSLLTGLLAWYNLDEASGNRLDSSTAGRTLSETGSVSNVAGVIGSAAYRDDGVVGNYLTRAYDAGLFCATQLSVSCFVRTTAADNVTRGVVGRHRPLADNNANTWILTRSSQTTEDRWQFRINGTGTGTTAAGSGSTIGVFSHVVFVWDGTQPTDATRLRCWINGTERTLTLVSTPTSMVDDTSSILLVHTRNTNLGAFRNAIDLLGMWSKPLTTTEIGMLYNGGAGLAYPF